MSDSRHQPPCKRFCGQCVGMLSERAAVLRLIDKRIDVMRLEPSVVAELKWIREFIESGGCSE
jgi:hypothetical protein